MKIFKFIAASLLLTQLHLYSAESMESAVCDETINAKVCNKGNCNKGNCNKGKGWRQRAGSFNHLSNVNDFAAETVISTGSTIPFNGVAVQSGHSIFQTAPDTFTFTKSGHYSINVVADALYPTTGAGIAYSINGTQYGSGTPTTYSDTPLILQQIVPISIEAPAASVNLSIIVTGETGLAFPAGEAAQISIVQLSGSRQ